MLLAVRIARRRFHGGYAGQHAPEITQGLADVDSALFQFEFANGPFMSTAALFLITEIA